MIPLRFAAVVALLTGALWAADATGGSAQCETLRDGDLRNYCRAVTKGHRTWCEWIRQGDLRTRCRWEVDRAKREGAR
ncbi:MAG: hypothetical protein EBR40_03105 [Proteobacteria bacterium]|nr:hypothetical protein [Pseudomonadota bacterium]